MKPSRILLASVFITAVILMVVGGVTSLVTANNQAKPVPADVEAYQQREVEYQQLIEQANQQLAEANQKLQAAQRTSVEAQQPASSVSNPSTSITISMEKAAQIASQAAAPGQSLQKKGELVNFEGKAAYELAFQNGSIYVDAQSGEVLFNGTVPQEIDANKAVQIASEYLKNKDVLQVDQITFRGAPLFRVIFKNGVMVYLDLTGQITYMLKSSPKAVDQEISSGSGGGGDSHYEGEHEQEHEFENEYEH